MFVPHRRGASGTRAGVKCLYLTDEELQVPGRGLNVCTSQTRSSWYLIPITYCYYKYVYFCQYFYDNLFRYVMPCFYDF